MSRRLARYHVHLFEWHSRTFYPFEDRLTDLELSYLDRCFSLANKEDEAPNRGYRHFSYYSYSHRVHGMAKNSSRIAYGTNTRASDLWPLAERVIAERGIAVGVALPGFETFTFYGLGWDFEEEQFKIYFRVEDLDGLGAQYADLMRSAPDGRRREGLVSATYGRTTDPERKIYFYPSTDLEDQGALRAVTMATSKRGAISQLDVPGSEVWQGRLNEVGQRVLADYTSIGETLDTIAYVSPDEFTLYFP